MCVNVPVCANIECNCTGHTYKGCSSFLRELKWGVLKDCGGFSNVFFFKYWKCNLRGSKVLGREKNNPLPHHLERLCSHWKAAVL